MARTVAIGKQDFKDIRENNDFYVDKTNFIKEWWEKGDAVTLIVRPKGFGKTLNMSMLDAFFSVENAGRADLFEGLSIWEEEEYKQLQGTWPVIFLSFANVKAITYEDMIHDISNVIADIFEDNRFLLNSSALLDTEKSYYINITENTSAKEIPRALQKLSKFLYRYYGKKVIIILDAFDMPMQEAYVNGYWDDMIEFMHEFLAATFKANQYSKQAIMTGITSYVADSIFSGLNNLHVITTTSNRYETSFGFTEKEVLKSLDEYKLSSEKQRVKEWYGGFCFGDYDDIYNPLSIINFLDKKRCDDYWICKNLSTIVSKLIWKSSKNVKAAIGNLLQGKSTNIELKEEVMFNQLDRNQDAIWGFLLANGYLKVIDSFYCDRGHYEYSLALPNKEGKHIFENMINSWFDNVREHYNSFIETILSNDLVQMNSDLSMLAEEIIDDSDFEDHFSMAKTLERFYYGLILGLIVKLQDRFEIKFDYEGRFDECDIIMTPKDKEHDGIVLGFEVMDSEQEKDLQSATNNALKQIIEREYATSLQTSGVPYSRIRIYGFALQGKEVLIEGGYLSDFENNSQHEGAFTINAF